MKMGRIVYASIVVLTVALPTTLHRWKSYLDESLAGGFRVLDWPQDEFW